VGRRVLVTGLSTFWGGRVAKALEADPSVDVIVGLDREEPTIELERTEYVRSDENYSILARIVRATKVDTIVHTFLVVDSTGMSSRRIHEINVIGTMNLFAAASAPGSTVRTVAVKSSTLVYGSSARDPNVFREEHQRSGPPGTVVERSLLETEGYVRDFAEDNPHVTVSMLRFSNVLGEQIRTPLSKALSLPVVPRIFGFDPRFQFVHEDDVIRAILFVLEHNLPGVYNVAGDGLLPWSEVAGICGKQTFPLPPFGFRGIASAPLSRLGIDLTPELLDLMRYGRGVDNRP
jgi:UDP-glucose 4-epimerase